MALDNQIIPVREALDKYRDEYGGFTGVFQKLGIRDGRRGRVRTVLLSDIRDSEHNILCDHLWFNFSQGFAALGNLDEGDVIQFEAKATLYIKGYWGRKRKDTDTPLSQDFQLSFLRNIRRPKSGTACG